MRVKYKVTIRGTRPFLHHAVGEDTIPLEKQPKTGVAGNDPTEWRKTVRVRKSDRQLYVGSDQVLAVWREGAKYTKKGRGSIKTDVASTLQIEGVEEVFTGLYLPENWETEQLTGDKEQSVYLDVRAAKNPKTKGINIRYRVAMKEGWEISFVGSFDNTIVAPAQMHAALIDAGTLCGLGNGRAIGLGRFEVVSFEAVE